MLICDYCKEKITRESIRKVKIEMRSILWKDNFIEREFEICPQCASKLINKLEEDKSEAEEPKW